MTDKDIAVPLQKRDTIRKGLHQLRTDGMVPAVIHDHGKESTHVMAEYGPLVKVYQEAGKHHPVHLELEGKKHLALIKDADFEPVKHQLRHIVFQAIKQNEKVTAEIPVTLAGDDIPALKASLLILTQTDVVTVEALPKDLPDALTVDATQLAEVGDRLTVADIVAPKGVTIMTDVEQVVAMVEMPKDQVAEANAAAADLAADAAGNAEAPADHSDEKTSETSDAPAGDAQPEK